MYIATLLMYGGIFNGRLIANLLPNTTVKQFLADHTVMQYDRLLALYSRLSLRPSVTLWIVALSVTVCVGSCTSCY